jgi:hypothetical protein
MLSRIVKLCVAAGVVAAVAGCDDDLGLAAFAVRDPVNITVYAMNGTAQTLPAGIELRGLNVVRIDPSWSFDLAFDLDASNAVVVHTVRSVSTELISLPRIGIQTDTTGFDRIIKAPTSGFVYDSSLTMPAGRTLLVDKIDPTCNRLGGAFLGFNIRAKIVIDSINVSRRAIYLKVLSNPNCGFRSLQPGEPKD